MGFDVAGILDDIKYLENSVFSLKDVNIKTLFCRLSFKSIPILDSHY